ncbi:MAG: hypothetical protein ACE5J4_01165 [Candidatus Aenigmatarchaeota archaeon]
MVWARTKLMIHDDLLHPRKRIKFSFSGPHPEKFYKELPDLLETTFRITELNIEEKEFHWTGGDPQKFSVRWEIHKDLDKFSYLWLEIKLKGKSSKGIGNATIIVEGAIRTEYPQDTYWQRSIFYEFLRMFWHSTFYASTRDNYIREGRKLLGAFIAHLKELTRG